MLIARLLIAPTGRNSDATVNDITPHRFHQSLAGCQSQLPVCPVVSTFTRELE
ncbi:hypothetical protein [Microseira wollei]|uniref:hypothetical protein n=1 Tax=Microseira wollei TaxID=467598 RepID=UPI001CFCA861|nr:hypothetical protein [Microseira wollei]